MLDHRDTQHRRRRGELAWCAKVGPRDTRRHHLALVLRTLFRGERFSRAEISRRTGLTRVTVSDLVAELIDEKLLVEVGQSAAKRAGKPGTLLSIDPDGRRVVSLDLSQPAEMHGAVLDLLGRVTYREVRPAPGRPRPPLDRGATPGRGRGGAPLRPQQHRVPCRRTRAPV